MKDRSHDEAMAELFGEDPAFAVEYLDQLFQDGEQSDLMVALRQIAQRNAALTEGEQREAKVKALEAALIEGEQSGDPAAFDRAAFEAFKAGKRATLEQR